MIRSILALTPVIPVLTIEALEDAVPLAHALVSGGLPVVEVTLRTPVALAAIAAIRMAVPAAVVGAGTLRTAADFDRASDAGAQFGVTPGLTASLVRAARSAPFPLLPGILTPSELMAALEWQFDTFKFFPAQPAGGVELLRALHGPFPDAKFCPTGGMTELNAAQYLALPNVICVGGSWMVPRDALHARDWQAIEASARAAATLGSTTAG